MEPSVVKFLYNLAPDELVFHRSIKKHGRSFSRIFLERQALVGKRSLYLSLALFLALFGDILQYEGIVVVRSVERLRSSIFHLIKYDLVLQ